MGLRASGDRWTEVASLAEPPAVCRPPLEGGFSPEQGGFWGPHGHIVSSLAECRTLDFRPGLLLLHHLSPANLSQPDQVIRASSFPSGFRFGAGSPRGSGSCAAPPSPQQTEVARRSSIARWTSSLIRGEVGLASRSSGRAPYSL